MFLRRIRFPKIQCLGNPSRQLATTVDENELEHFNSFRSEWWDELGPLKALHAMNRLRVPFIRDRLVDLQVVSEEFVDTPKPLLNLDILDVGCGGGILSEPLAKLGGNVTGTSHRKLHRMPPSLKVFSRFGRLVRPNRRSETTRPIDGPAQPQLRCKLHRSLLDRPRREVRRGRNIGNARARLGKTSVSAGLLRLSEAGRVDFCHHFQQDHDRLGSGDSGGGVPALAGSARHARLWQVCVAPRGAADARGVRLSYRTCTWDGLQSLHQRVVVDEADLHQLCLTCSEEGLICRAPFLFVVLPFL